MLHDLFPIAVNGKCQGGWILLLPTVPDLGQVDWVWVDKQGTEGQLPSRKKPLPLTMARNYVVQKIIYFKHPKWKMYKILRKAPSSVYEFHNRIRLLLL